MIAIVDYGVGNLKSVKNAASFLGYEACVTDSVNKIKKADKIIFPGVGHFGRAVKELKKRRLFNLLKNRITEGVSFLGICLGMQILFEESQEAGGIKGLGVIKGKVKRFPSGALAVPHMGWNRVKIKDKKTENKGNGIFKGIKDRSFFYFVHAYYCQPKEKEVVSASTDYGTEFACAVSKQNIWAVQFHIEKSQASGLKVFDNFLRLP
ncbi:MAG: imidazole glycerol phosphate synthase subunit HisH [Candidatus Omnitrophica bacterium]|nr:imidazole glycerol phosphate synthase subunit HisH [Candidatus Omnitrophota bacterium]MDD5429187.1 imidazole glycerol phosphate synthase subunit HisH [Candidatus Omnitrophota bacterium]